LSHRNSPRARLEKVAFKIRFLTGGDRSKKTRGAAFERIRSRISRRADLSARKHFIIRRRARASSGARHNRTRGVGDARTAPVSSHVANASRDRGRPHPREATRSPILPAAGEIQPPAASGPREEKMEFDLRELERAVDAVRARANGTGWAESERKYKEKIEQLEAINRALVQELSGARGAGASTTMDGASTDALSMGTAAASRRPIHQQQQPATASSPSKVLRSDSYKALRCSQTHKLTVVQLDGDSTSGGESGRSTPAPTVGLGVGDGGGGGGAFVAQNRHRVSDASIASSSSSPDHARDGEIERLAEEASARLVINDPRESPGGTNDGLGGIQGRGGE
jgi:hypothetical protein